MEKTYKQILLFYGVFWGLLSIFLLVFGDVEIALFINGKTESWWSHFIEIYTTALYPLIGFIAIFALLSVFVKKWEKYNRVLLGAWLSYAFSLLIIVPAKAIIGRERPFVELGDKINNFGHDPTDKSMPSGHSGYSASTMTPLAMKESSPIKRWLYIAIHIFMMYTRLFLGVHWLSDVLVGSIIGVACSYLAVYLLDYLYSQDKMTQKLKIIIAIFCTILTIYSATL